jgi:hypothetical protein
MFAFIYVLDQRSKAQTRTGKPSRLIRLSALSMGIVGLGAFFWPDLQLPWFVLLGSLFLLGYGVFGWFATVQSRPPETPQPKKDP